MSISCTCVECESTAHFESMKAADTAGWYILGINIGESDYYVVCPKCDTSNKTTVTISDKPKEEPAKPKLINSKSVSYD